MSAAESHAESEPSEPAHCVTLCVVYCTGNAGKFREASHVFDEWNASAHPLKVEYRQIDADPAEIQGTAEEVCRDKVKAATKILVERGALNEVARGNWSCEVVTEDVGLELGCLNGFPGVYCKPMLEAIGDSGLWELVRRYEDKSARVTCSLGSSGSLSEVMLGSDRLPEAPDRDTRGFESRMFVGSLEGSIGPPRGDVKHGATSWNSVFTPAGRAQTFGETPFEEQAKFSHRRQAIMEYLENRQKSIVASWRERKRTGSRF